MPGEPPDVEWDFESASLRDGVIGTFSSKLGSLSIDFAQSSGDDVIVRAGHVARAANLLVKPELLPEGLQRQLAEATCAHVFLSYSSNDEAWAREFQSDLDREGLSTFRASRSIAAGADWDAEIWEAIRHCNIFVPLLTPSALAGDWTQFELGAARGLRKKVVPVLRHVSVSDLPDALSQFQAREVQTRQQQRQLVHELKVLFQRPGC
jgi:hypothetical protein